MTIFKPLLRVTVAALVSGALVVAAGGQASAATTPVIGTFPIDDHFVDDGATAACGFPVSVDLTGAGRFWVFFDQQGNPIRVQVREDATGTMSANGISLTEVDHNTQTFEPDGTTTEVGLVFREFLPGLGVVITDRGKVSATSDGTITFEAGPHPALDGDFAALCAALTP